MGDLQTDQGESLDLRYVPAPEFARVCSAPGLAPAARAAAFAALARINALYMIAGAWSGHIGTSFSSLDIMSWLFLNELRDLDKGDEACDIFFSSKGHDAPALYAVLIGLGLLPADKLHELRRLHGLPGHPHVETPFIQANTGSLGMGISKAKGMAIANRLAGRPRRIFVLTGDGELQEGQLWESLATGVHRGLGEIVAIVDHNKVQSDTWVEKVNDLGDVEAKFRAFGWHVSRCDGHDLEAFSKTLRALDAITDRPKVIIADTVKGKGVSFMEAPTALSGGNDLYLFHSGAPPEAQYLDGLAQLSAEANRQFAAAGLGTVAMETRVRNPRREPRQTDNLVAAYGKALVAAAKANPALVALDADLIKDCGLLDFAAQFPDRFIECGIAEQDMVSMACGLAHRGALPVVHSFACFLAARPNEQIYNQCSESTKVMYVGSLAGLLPGGPGHSHQSVRDISALGGVPNLVMAEPSSEAETAALVAHLTGTVTESSYLRLVSVKWPMPFEYGAKGPLTVGAGWTIREGSDLAVIGYGPWMLANAWHAAEALAAEGISVRLINLPWLNRIDRGWLAKAIGSTRRVVTLDNHYLPGGQGEMVGAALAELGLDPGVRLRRVGVTELPECGTNDEVAAHHKLDIAGLTAAFREHARA